MGDQLFVRSAAIVGVLVNVDDRLGSPRQSRTGQRQKRPPRHCPLSMHVRKNITRS
jgi:hypothetical protein